MLPEILNNPEPLLLELLLEDEELELLELELLELEPLLDEELEDELELLLPSASSERSLLPNQPQPVKLSNNI
jgi:hypothetical protein